MYIINYIYFRVEVPIEHFTNPILDVKEENDLDVPLPTDQVSTLKTYTFLYILPN